MSVCRGCAGTGIGAKATPREVQIAEQPIWLTKQRALRVEGVEQVHHRPAHARVVVDSVTSKGKLAFQGPLLAVIDHVKQRLADGYEFEAGSALPDRRLLCEWCGGTGELGAILTAHAMAEAIGDA